MKQNETELRNTLIDLRARMSKLKKTLKKPLFEEPLTKEERQLVVEVDLYLAQVEHDPALANRIAKSIPN